MGDAGGGMAAHWAALYGGGGGGGGGNGGAAGEGTVSSPTSGGSGGAGSPTRVVPGIEGGRVGKPARRRSRASRRAPVTLLNTDTSNFRAMVQQFTGIPAPPYTAAGGGAGPVISFGAAAGDYATGGGAMPVRPSPTPASVMSFDHLSHHRQTTSAASSLQSQLFRPQQHHHQYGGDVGYGAGGAGDMFLHGFESSPEDRLLLQSIQAAQMLPRPTTTSANNTNGYNFG